MNIKKEAVHIEKTIAKDIKKIDEKVLFNIGKFAVKKKHYLALLIPTVVFFIGLNKISSIQKAGTQLPTWLIVAVNIACIAISLYVSYKNNNRPFWKQVAKTYLSAGSVLIMALLLFGYDLIGILFVVPMTISVGFWIYHIHG